MSELISSLKAAKRVIKLEDNVLNIEKGSFSRSIPKGKKGQKKASTGDPSVGSVPKITKSKGKGKGNEGGRGRGKCFYYDEKGHWKRNCPEYFATRV